MTSCLSDIRFSPKCTHVFYKTVLLSLFTSERRTRLFVFVVFLSSCALPSDNLNDNKQDLFYGFVIYFFVCFTVANVRERFMLISLMSHKRQVLVVKVTFAISVNSVRKNT